MCIPLPWYDRNTSPEKQAVNYKPVTVIKTLLLFGIRVVTMLVGAGGQ